MINDIDETVDESIAKTTLFADDSRVTGGITNKESVEEFQTEIEKIYKWQSDNNMKFNSGKFELLQYGRNKELISSTIYFASEINEIIEEKSPSETLGSG